MCGIAGQVALGDDVRVDAACVQGVVEQLTHRGPDDEGLYVDTTARVALGMRRLAIIDLVSGHQPMFSEDGSIACVFNGEIYNFATLREELVRRGHAFASGSDTEVIVHLYEEEGVACVRRLRGMFAFAVWDARTGTLMVARDRLGKKPLYYFEAGGRLAFASELTALRGVPGFPDAVDPAAVDLYLTYGYIPAPRSIYAGVRKLPPASVLTVRDGAISVVRYWEPDFSRPIDMARPDVVRTLREAITRAVELRLVSDVPVGCFLSGGIDSSAVVALMTQLSSKPVKTFSIGFRDDRFNELAYARSVAETYRTDHYESVLEPDAADVLTELVDHFGEPFGDSSAVPTWWLSKLARRHVAVALNGDGGDELFAGYGWYERARQVDALARWMPATVPATLSRALALLGRGRAAQFQRLARLLELPAPARFSALRSFIDHGDRESLYSVEFRRVCGTASEAYLQERTPADAMDPLAAWQATDINAYLPEDLLVKMDRMTMAHSLEARSPLLDDDLVEVATALPAALKVDRRGGKAIFRDVVADLVPPDVLARPKMGFSIPAASWLRGPLRGACERSLRRGVLHDTGWFAPAGITALLDAHMTGAADRSVQLWNLLVLARWIERFAA